ncbi:hypothetical protein SANTM175S_01991 [Streptomyces antimycoticus]
MPDRTHIRTACQTDAPSLGRGLAELAEQAAAGTPDSCGATATAVLAEESSGAAADRTTAATHPDLSALVSVQMSAGEGPILAALDTGRPAGADDLLHDDRWPSYRARALDAGVRSTATLPFACDGLTVTVSVYGLRPGPLKKAAQGTTELLGDLATESMARDRLYRAALVQVDQLERRCAPGRWSTRRAASSCTSWAATRSRRSTCCAGSPSGPTKSWRNSPRPW